MNYNATSTSPGQEMGRVLFTGSGENMIDSLIKTVKQNFKVHKCAPAESELLATVGSVKPHAIVICLQNEIGGMLYIYDILSSNDVYQNIPVFLVGYADDCERFKTNVTVKYLETFTRPLDHWNFLTALEKAVTQSIQLLHWESESSHDTPEEIKNQESQKSLFKKAQRLALINGRKSVLVVDDDVRMLNVLKLYLEDLYDVTVVPSGKLALKYLDKKQADLVLLDYMMPDMTGPEVLKEIRENSPQPNIPVVFLTGVSDKDFVMRGLALRPAGYLLKPISREELLERVTTILLGL